MNLINSLRKLFRGKNEPMPNQHGPAVKFAKPIGNYVEVKVVPATTSGKPDCVCGSGKCKCEENKKVHAETIAKKQKAASKTKPVAKKPVAKAASKKDAIKKDIADTPVAKKPAPKTTAKKSAPKKK